jgi:acyl-CoA dehydrogenase
MLNFSLSPAQLKLQKKAREFALKEILPVAWYYDEIDETPLPVLKKAYEAGLINADIPKEYGGKGYGLIENVIITEEFSAACPGLATSIFDNSLGMEPLRLSKNDTLKEKYFPQILNNFKLICFATSEPTMGSDVAGIRCSAKRDGEDYILNGTKYWITNGGLADYMSIFATVDPDTQHEGICAFIVEKDWKGVTIGRRIPKLGQRGSNTVGINLKDVRVPKENVLAPPGEGFILAMQTFSRTRPAIGAFAVGTARSAMEYAIDYTKKRRAFGTKIANFQAIQHKIAEMYQKVETSRLLVWKAAWEADQGLDPTITASIAKFYSTEDEGTSEVQRYIVSGYAMNVYQPTMPPLEDLPLHRETDPGGVKPHNKKGMTAWRCRICGYVHYGDEPPEECPYCFFPKTAFKQV